MPAVQAIMIIDKINQIDKKNKKKAIDEADACRSGNNDK
jgi:hypothetical protein